VELFMKGVREHEIHRA